MNTGTENLVIADLSIGISASGMDSYKESLKADLLITSKEKINNFAEVEAALNKGWQGAALDKFKTQLQTTATKICEDLDKEYQDLENRLTDIQSAYFSADNNIIQD